VLLKSQAYPRENEKYKLELAAWVASQTLELISKTCLRGDFGQARALRRDLCLHVPSGAAVWQLVKSSAT
jgi:hypothetical protein